MQNESTVRVHSFRIYDSHVESPRVAAFKASLAVIEALEGEPIEGTAEDVPVAELDEQGHYRRLPTGWGELR
jgi:hypothetical protein